MDTKGKDNNTSTVISEDKKVKEQVQKLVKARLMVIPNHLQIAVGSKKYTVKELIKSVEQGNEIGNQLMEMQLQYLRDLASGKIYEELNYAGSSINYKAKS